MEKEINLSFNFFEALHSGSDAVFEIDNKKYFRKGGDNLFVNGAHSLFLWSKNEDFGYKIFTNSLYNDVTGIYNGSFSFNPSLTLTKKQVETLHFSHKALHKLNFTPDSFNLINFNNGEFYGLKMQRIKGTMPTNGWCRRKRIDHEFDDLEQAMKDINLIPRASKEFVGENLIIDSENNHLYLIDLDWMSIEGREDLILETLRNV